MKPVLEVIAAMLIGLAFGYFLGELVMGEADAAPKDLNVVLLSSNNTVSLRLPVTDETVEAVQEAMINKKRAGAKELFLVLNSPGGSISAGRTLIETAKGLGIPVHTISMFSASMSFIISQYLDTRYVLDSSTLMSHRAYVKGMNGSIPGTLLSQALALHNEIAEISKHITDRAKMDPQTYDRLIADELWMTGNISLNMHFADKVVKVQCDSSLQGDDSPIKIATPFGSLNVVFKKCPLFTDPKLSSDGGDEKAIRNAFQFFIEQLVPNSIITRWRAHVGISK